MTGSRRKSHWWCCSLALPLLTLALTVQAQRPTVVSGVAWAPRALAVGSPCLFTVELDGAALSVVGHWMGQELVFSRGATPNAWYALAGVDVEGEPGQRQLSLEIALPRGSSLNATRMINVLPSTYKTLALHVPSKYVEPDAAMLARIAAEKEIKDAAFAHAMEQVAWRGDFVLPVHAATTETFGTRRVFNGETASIHRGLDFRAHTGTPVAAANSGVVVLAQNLFYEGGFVVIDHGQHFMTMYMHLSEIGVAAGEHVSKGQRIGLSGATGRVTGPHLHFAVRWQGAYLDPAKLFVMKLPDPASK
jgi:murein DD-endopeptidase MepM/ murein hydrolase activator NlpD